MDPSDNRIREIHRQAPLTDVHIHPSLKAYLFNRNLWRHYCSGKAFNPFASRTDFKMLHKGGVRVMWAAHYLPERQIFRDCFWLRLSKFVVPRTYHRLTKGALIDRVQEIIDRMEREVKRKPDKAEVARSASDVKRISAEGKIAVVHTIEGAHVLEGKIENLEILSKRGVAMMTLTHFYHNDIVTQVNGIPTTYFINKICKFDFQTGGQPPLTDFGREVLRKMADVRMIPDISHCTPEARAEIFAELNGALPIVATHVGAWELNPDPYNLNEEEIREIAKSGGAVGIIFMTYFLDEADPKNGKELLWKTIEHIRKVTNSWDHIMLGTDFDGFTDPPDDIRDSSQMGVLTELLLERGVPEADVLKILGGNAQRVLESGWK